MLFHIVFYCVKNQNQEIYLLCKMTSVIYRNSSTVPIVGWKGQDSMGHKKTMLTFASCAFETFLFGDSVPTFGRISSRLPAVHDHSLIRKVLQSFLVIKIV